MTTERDAKPFKTQGIKTPAPVPSVTTTQFVYETSEQCIQAEFVQKKFTERQHLKIDKFEYERNGSDPGLILIFNQESFNDRVLDSRRGSRRDVNEIVICFQRLGFNVEYSNIMPDYTTDQIRQKLARVAEMDFANYNCLIIFYMSHGEEFNRLNTKDGTIGAEEFWISFRNNESLKSKPKLFIFQACKGDNFSTTGQDEGSSPLLSSTPSPTTITTSKTFSTSFLYANLLIVYSSVEGNASYRHSLTGSWFIQELCKNFSAYGRRDDVVSLLLRTTKCVCGNYFHSEYSQQPVQKQMPFFVSTLRKKFYLNRNKDRDLIIRLIESNEEILKSLKAIQGQLDTLVGDDKKKKKDKI